jgi:site-specific DNA recombinase
LRKSALVSMLRNRRVCTPDERKLDNADTNARKGYIRSIIDAIEVDDKAIRIIGSRDILQAAIAGKQIENGNVRGFVRKWRARRDSNS